MCAHSSIVTNFVRSVAGCDNNWARSRSDLLALCFSTRVAKNSQLRLAVFCDKIMQRLVFPLIGLIVFGGVAPLAALASGSNSPEQSTSSFVSLQPSAATHETRAASQG